MYISKGNGILLAVKDNKQKQKIGPVISSNLKRGWKDKIKEGCTFKLT